jgi:hypothetical protein
METIAIFDARFTAAISSFTIFVNRTVRILRVIHGARDWERLLFPSK